MLKKRATYSTEDMVLWQRVTSQVTPLKSATKSNAYANADVIMRQRKILKNDIKIQKRNPSNYKPLGPTETVSKKTPLKQVSPIDLRHGEKAGIDGSTQRRLFRGETPIDLRLDLHGMTAARAQAQLIKFILTAANEGYRCVLVITGKGSGVLSRHVPNWLKQLPLSLHVLALAQARPKDGGDGAFYVLLRRKRGGK